VTPRLLTGFFIVPSFTTRHRPRTDDSNGGDALNVHHCQQTPVSLRPQKHKSFLQQRMTRIVHDEAQRIAERCRGLLE